MNEKSVTLSFVFPSPEAEPMGIVFHSGHLQEA